MTAAASLDRTAVLGSHLTVAPDTPIRITAWDHPTISLSPPQRTQSMLTTSQLKKERMEIR